MRWKTAPKTEHGDTRTAQYFALWPTELSDGNTVWLEWYSVDEEYQVIYSDGTTYWKVIKSWAH